MTTDQCYTWLIEKGFKFAEIRKINAYQMRNIIAKVKTEET